MSKFFSGLRAFFREYSDVIWPALCLVFCGLTILFAALRSNRIEIEDNTGAVVIVKHNPGGIIKIN